MKYNEEYTYEEVVKFYDGNLMQTQEELDELLAIMKEHKINSVLEIGFFRGGTTRAFSDIIKGGYIISMDKSLSIPKEDLKSTAAYLEQNNNRFTFIQYDSGSRQAKESVAMCLSGFTNKEGEFLEGFGKVDMLFIDGWHSGYYPLKDYVNYEAFVKARGLIVWHDLNMRNVARFYEEMVNETGWEHKEIISLKNPDMSVNGIGILFKK